MNKLFPAYVFAGQVRAGSCARLYLYFTIHLQPIQDDDSFILYYNQKPQY